MALYGSLLFHLNLSYSSIEREERARVVERCYRPLLELLERLPWLELAIEAPAHTFERIGELDPEWLRCFAARRAEGRIELIGSGDTQLIGPLVPASVNGWNQKLGVEAYERMFGARPTTALVGELAWSQGLVDAYLDAGYDLVLMEWNNPRKNHPEWSDEWRYRMARTESPTGRGIDVGWIDAVLFQKFQRVLHDELDVDDYVASVRESAGDGPRHVFLYANDAEIFDHRPGRYSTEAVLPATSEWRRMQVVLERLRDADVCLSTPRVLRREPGLGSKRTLRLTSAADPIPVKKQPKYNITRWALSGRDDGLLNRLCFRRAQVLEGRGGTAEEWRALVRGWASDLRTHLTEKRWAAHLAKLEAAGDLPESRVECTLRAARAADPFDVEPISIERDARRIRVSSRRLSVELLPRRGLAIEAFRPTETGPGALFGTLPHGALDDIDWAADFYSGHVVAQLPGRPRVTDLAAVEPEVDLREDSVELRAIIPTALGTLEKRVLVGEGSMELFYDLSGWGTRPAGNVRLGIVTVDPDAFGEDLWLTTANGGTPESFPLRSEFDHGASVSPIVSAQAALGATDGRLVLDDGTVALDLVWDPGQAAVLPMVTHRRVSGRRFLRIAFSVSELDETHRPGASLPSFRLTLRARRLVD